ncbi:unnamed protein product [Rhizophagus irregularis]|nr:unnamed protein product [Rhizophagus irregularis]
MTFEFEENDIEETAEEEVDEETEYETEEEIGEEAEEEAKEEAEYENEDEAESKTEENQVDDTETEEQQIEKNIEREVEQEETNTKKRSTSGMAGHIKSKHKLMKEKGKKQLTIRESINNSEVIILGVTTDNASNNVIFLKAVESDLSQRYIYNDSEDKHVRCLAHIINLAAQQVLTTLKATDNDELSNEEVGSLIVKMFALDGTLQDFRDTPNRFENGKEVAINAINKLKIYYNKTDSTLYAVSLILDPRLKVEYMKNNEWETQWVDRTKKTVSELYIMLYTPQETQNTNIKYNSSDEDLVSHICKWRRIETVSEFDRYLNADHAQALCDTLN